MDHWGVDVSGKGSSVVTLAESQTVTPKLD